MSSIFVDKPETKFTEKKKLAIQKTLSLDWLFADNLDLIDTSWHFNIRSYRFSYIQDFMQELQNKIHITLCYIKPGMVDIVLFQCN